MNPLYLPFPHMTRFRVQVGAWPPAGDQAAIEQRRSFLDEAFKNADKAFGEAMAAHSGYESALAFNAAARDHADKLRALCENILATGPALTTEESEFAAAQRDFAKTLQTSLDIRRGQLEEDQAKHTSPPVFFLPPNYFAPPLFVPPPTPEPHVDPSKPPPEPPPPPGSEYVFPLLLVLGAVAAYALALPVIGRLLSKKGY